ncbi:SPASM domain-containing protein [Candidatus Dependentiae bacterium]|nr:SPASM domain-containing protein [Candidatus Dependentiae bacterium]
MELKDNKCNCNKKEELYKKYPPFKNQLYRDLRINYENFFIHRLTQINNREEDYIKQVKRVSFELSNMCNYSFIHKKCPTSKYKNKKILSSEIVYKTIDELKKINYSGVIAFHRYNEPLIDPRLFQFIEYVNKNIPLAKIFILSNGFYINQYIADKFFEYKIWILAASAYFPEEYQRLINLEVKIPYFVFWSELDERKSIYESEEFNLNLECNAPILDVNICSDGRLGLCCMDWKGEYSFSDLSDKTLAEVLRSENVLKIHNALINKKRVLPICRRCSIKR